MNRQGMRVLAVSQKSFIEKDCNFAIEDEKEMVLIGYLAFLDPPKPSVAEAIEQLYTHGVVVKILSGDNDIVVKAIARQHHFIFQTHSISEDIYYLSVAGAR